MTTEVTMQDECYSCQHRREVPGDCHIRCEKPDAKMKGHRHGIANGWFVYPLLYDPTWKTRWCGNFEAEAGTAVSRPVSRTVSPKS